MEKKEIVNYIEKTYKDEGLSFQPNQILALYNSCENLGILKSIGDNKNWVLNFFRICIKLKLDPEKREIYAVKYGSSFSVIIDYHQYIKRASMDENFQGYNTLLVEQDENGNELPLQKQYVVFSCRPKNWDRDYVAKFKMNEWHKGMSEWNQKPQYMLQKTAIKNGLAHCFPKVLDDYNSIENGYGLEDENPKKIEPLKVRDYME